MSSRVGDAVSGYDGEVRSGESVSVSCSRARWIRSLTVATLTRWEGTSALTESEDRV